MTVYEIARRSSSGLRVLVRKKYMGTFVSVRWSFGRLCTALPVPKVMLTSEGDKCDGLHVLCMMCMYYAYPTRRFEMIAIFGTSLSRMSRADFASSQLAMGEVLSLACRTPSRLQRTRWKSSLA